MFYLLLIINKNGSLDYDKVIEIEKSPHID